MLVRVCVGGALRGAPAHPPHLGGEGVGPAAGVAQRPEELHKLKSLAPVITLSSLAAALGAALLAHGGKHLADVRGQQVVHLVALWKIIIHMSGRFAGIIRIKTDKAGNYK